MEPSFASQLLVNYGNCLSQFGRHVEAITCYRRALDMEPANGMAAGNLAQELAYAAEIMGAYRHEYLALAHDLLLHAFGPTMHFNYGSPQAQVDFRYTMKRLQHFMDSHQEKIPLPEPIETIPGSKSRQDYAQFCLTNGLFLNAWAGDDGLSPATADEISFGPIVTTAADRDLIQELLRILNEIKEAFATARYLLFLSQNESDIQNEASEMTYYFSSLDSFVINGLYPGLCKTAYSRAFDVLDKVARIINVYFNVRKREDSFWNVLAEKQSLGKEHRIRYGVRPEIYAFDNYGLYALADLCIDYFESKHIDLRIFDKRRNRITHDYLLVKLYLADEGGQIDHEMSLDDLKTQTIAVLKLVKYAIIYVVSSVNIAERGKETGDHVATIEYQKLQGMRFL